MPLNTLSNRKSMRNRAAIRKSIRLSVTSGRRPLWLNNEEADTLIALCMSASHDGGEVEAALFASLGTYFKGFASVNMSDFALETCAKVI